MRYVFLCCGLGLLAACGEPDDNPFVGGEVIPPVTLDTVALSPTSLVGLHANLFRPTCANSGCHDGTFEPDYRTVYSTYNTLVEQPVIKNDPQNSFTYRVVPGNVVASQLVARLEYDIDGNSGIMPLALEPDSDYPARKAELIEDVKTWIREGAQPE